MIFAPRSCPSKPGFATTTRILPLDAASTAGRDPTRHAAADDSRCPPPGGTGSAACGHRRHPFPRRGLHVVGRLLARPWNLPRPPRGVREHAAPLLPPELAAAGRRSGVATAGIGAGRRRVRGRGLVGGGR